MFLSGLLTSNVLTAVHSADLCYKVEICYAYECTMSNNMKLVCWSLIDGMFYLVQYIENSGTHHLRFLRCTKCYNLSIKELVYNLS